MFCFALQFSASTVKDAMHVSGSTWPQNLAVRSVIVFNSTPSGFAQCNRSHQHPEGWHVPQQLFHLRFCKDLHAAVVPPPTAVQA
eukprot:215131-Pelagomonas_calceolata.AAC.1